MLAVALTQQKQNGFEHSERPEVLKVQDRYGFAFSTKFVNYLPAIDTHTTVPASMYYS